MARIDDGHQTLIAFAADGTVEFYEKTVTPPGIEGGEEIDTTTMLNETWRTRAPRSLSTSSCTVAYDPVIYDSILALVNVVNLITVTFPDGATLEFWGWLKSFKPNELREGEQPTAEIEIVPGNQNDSGAETAPVYTAPA